MASVPGVSEQTMSKLLLADVILAIHFGWIVFVIVGQILILLGIALSWKWTRNFYFRSLHMTMMVFVALEVLFELACPLTIWENRLRGFGAGAAPNHAEADSLIANWLGIMFVADMDGSSWPFLLAYLVFTSLIVWSFLKAPPRLPMSPAKFVTLLHLVVVVVFVLLTLLHLAINWRTELQLPLYHRYAIFFLAEWYLWLRLAERHAERL